ncbi:MAG TPA: nucleoside triphosphate pyrophosphatase [Solimonas sp.]|nr:nucleoside triphosphate pyrophosphatase [Solimonas sp.]
MLNAISAQRPLILASGSKYRAELLARLRVPFEAIASQVDEATRPNETAEHLTKRLALAKAQALLDRSPDRWVLGSDQAAACSGLVLGKPGNRLAAVRQLQLLAGREVQFMTAVALLGGPRQFTALDITTVRMRHLEAEEIERYVDLEPALDCAGSFKCEGLGISLFDEIRSTDPTALIGLPLILVRQLLARAGMSIP